MKKENYNIDSVTFFLSTNKFIVLLRMIISWRATKYFYIYLREFSWWATYDGVKRNDNLQDFSTTLH